MQIPQAAPIADYTDRVPGAWDDIYRLGEIVSNLPFDYIICVIVGFLTVLLFEAFLVVREYLRLQRKVFEDTRLVSRRSTPVDVLAERY